MLEPGEYQRQKELIIRCIREFGSSTLMDGRRYYAHGWCVGDRLYNLAVFDMNTLGESVTIDDIFNVLKPILPKPSEYVYFSFIWDGKEIYNPNVIGRIPKEADNG